MTKNSRAFKKLLSTYRKSNLFFLGGIFSVLVTFGTGFVGFFKQGKPNLREKLESSAIILSSAVGALVFSQKMRQTHKELQKNMRPFLTADFKEDMFYLSCQVNRKHVRLLDRALQKRLTTNGAAPLPDWETMKAIQMTDAYRVYHKADSRKQEYHR